MGWLFPHYRQVRKRLHVLLRQVGRSEDDAEDLIQESLLRLCEYSRSAHVVDQEAFLIRTARNLAIDLHRANRRHPHELRSIEEIEAVISREDQSPAPDVIYDAHERLLKIGKTLDRVSRRTRDIYFAHRAGYSYTEISEWMKVSKSTIEKHIARAVLALMEARDLG